MARSQAREGLLGSWQRVPADLSDVPISALWAHRIDTHTGEVSLRMLWGHSMDQATVNPYFFSRRTRYVYFDQSYSGDPMVHCPAQAFTRLDTVTGEAQHYYPGPRCFCEELIFAPGPNAQTVEDDGYLMGMVFDASKSRSCLVVLDAADFSKGPLTTIWLQHRIPRGLHGHFCPEVFGPRQS
ncbi:hypothetical protein WJX84_005312 [Apatococcus fuscideae]